MTATCIVITLFLQGIFPMPGPRNDVGGRFLEVPLKKNNSYNRLARGIKNFNKMNKRILTGLLSLCLMIVELSAQDVIVTRDSRKIEAIVTYVGEGVVRYKHYYNPNGPTYRIEINQIASISYENGGTQKFYPPGRPTTSTSYRSDYSRPVGRDYTQFYIGKSEGYTVDGYFISGLSGAYFFSRQIGVGLVLRTNFYLSEIDELFFGAAFFANLGPKNSIVYFPLRFGLGTYDGENGWYASAGIAFRPVKVFSIGVKFDYAYDDFKEIDMDYLGINLTVAFHF